MALAISLIVIFLWINSTPSDEVRFGYNECIKLDPGESRIDPIDSVSIHEFLSNCSYDHTAIYLNRVISGKNKIFIALSTRLAPQEYIQKMKQDSLIHIFSAKEYSDNDKLFHSLFIRKNKNYIYRSLYNESKMGNMILIDMVNKDSLPVVSLYNDKAYLVNKLHCN
jgi:hypothetical protein